MWNKKDDTNINNIFNEFRKLALLPDIYKKNIKWLKCM